MTRLPLIRGPVARGVGSQDFVTNDDAPGVLALRRDAELELRVSQDQAALIGDLRGTLVHGQGESTQLLRFFLPDCHHCFVEGDVDVVVADGGLGGRGEEWFRHARAVLQPGREAIAADRPLGAVIGQTRTRQIPAHHAFDREHLHPLTHHGAAGNTRGNGCGGQVARDDVGDALEPPQGQLGEDAALVRDLRGEDPVVGGDAIARDEEKATTRCLVEIADLARVDVYVLRWQSVVRAGDHRMSPGR